MENLKYPVICISREYAAYGRTVARRLAELLDIPFYDRDFVTETAKRSGYSEEDIRREGEAMSRATRFLNSVMNNAMVYSSSYDSIFHAQKEVILELSKKPCIIVGRCAGYVLRDAGIPSFNVFLYADKDVRTKRAGELEENIGLDPKKARERHDILRETYYKQYTHQDLGDYHNYDICLNTGEVGPERCADIIAEIVLTTREDQ
ncbi:MAG: cytidylate kinase-like family protein [Lachnospiraceae bacterium]|nr:cytidylate kinase-like family protein [Lachnospiraceae bacterium]